MNEESEDKTEEIIEWVRKGFGCEQVYDDEELGRWAHRNNYLTIEEFLEWQRFNQHITLVDYYKSLNK